jgi:hypothetical protein
MVESEKPGEGLPAGGRDVGDVELFESQVHVET